MVSTNQDNSFSEKMDRAPILALDVWGHVYYLKYKNLKADYVKAFLGGSRLEKGIRPLWTSCKLMKNRRN